MRTAVVVDDRTDVLHVVAALLEALGFSTLRVGSPEQAAAKAAELSAAPDLLLTDWILSEARGSEVLAAFRAHWPDMPCLIMSGLSESNAEFREVASPITGFLPKPFTFDQLRQAVAGVGVSTKALSA